MLEDSCREPLSCWGTEGKYAARAPRKLRGTGRVQQASVRLSKGSRSGSGDRPWARSRTGPPCTRGAGRRLCAVLGSAALSRGCCSLASAPAVP